MADLTYRQLQAATTALAQDIARSAEANQAEAGHIEADARDTARISEMIAGMGVDSATVAETRELAKATSILGDAARSYATAGNTTARAAKAAHDQARSSHGGINEAYNRAQVDVRNLKPEWLRQQ
jgi:hypothetical protein